MNLAQERLGELSFTKKSGSEPVSDYSVPVLLAALAPSNQSAELKDDTLLVVVAASQSTSSIQGLTAVLKTPGKYDEASIKFPGMGRYEAKFPKDSEIKGGVMPLSLNGREGRTRAFYGYLDFNQVSREKFVPIFGDDPQEFAYELSQRLDLPMLPHWSMWFQNQVWKEPNGVIDCLTINCVCSVVTLDILTCRRILTEGRKAGRLTHAEEAHPDLREWQVRPLGDRVKGWIEDSLETVLFPTHKMLVTQGAMSELENCCQTPESFLKQHQKGEWGDVEVEIGQSNDLTVKLLEQNPNHSDWQIKSILKSRLGEALVIETKWYQKPGASQPSNVATIRLQCE